VFFDARGRMLPLVVEDGGNGEVTAAHPATTMLRVGGSAFILLSKYRCDLEDRGVATTLQVALPGAGGVWRLPVSQEGIADCGRGDPGSRVYVSPIEPTLLSTSVFG
jgi:hypothetical protein